jgi:hypothetical protein
MIWAEASTPAGKAGTVAGLGGTAEGFAKKLGVESFERAAPEVLETMCGAAEAAPLQGFPDADFGLSPEAVMPCPSCLVCL